VSTITVKLRAADEDDAAFREDFLRVASRIGISRDKASAFVQARSARPFSACRAADLVVVLDELLGFVRSATTHVNGGPACAE
jgi:hypothetical protein